MMIQMLVNTTPMPSAMKNREGDVPELLLLELLFEVGVEDGGDVGEVLILVAAWRAAKSMKRSTGVAIEMEEGYRGGYKV